MIRTAVHYVMVGRYQTFRSIVSHPHGIDVAFMAIDAPLTVMPLWLKQVCRLPNGETTVHSSVSPCWHTCTECGGKQWTGRCHICTETLRSISRGQHTKTVTHKQVPHTNCCYFYIKPSDPKDQLATICNKNDVELVKQYSVEQTTKRS